MSLLLSLQWKPVAPVEEVLPQRTVVFEDVSTAQHAGTVVKAVLKVSDKKQVRCITKRLKV